MSYIKIKNERSGNERRIGTPFTQEEYIELLRDMGFTGSEDAWLEGRVDELSIIAFETDTPMYNEIRRCQNPVIINMAEKAWRSSSYYSAIEAYIDHNGTDTLTDFANVCWQEEDITYVPYEQDYWYDGYGREMLRGYFEDDTIPSWIGDYIDYESYGRDNEDYDTYVGEYGYLYDSGGIDSELYSTTEMLGEYGWNLPDDVEVEEVHSEPYDPQPKPQPQEMWTPKNVEPEMLLQIL